METTKSPSNIELFKTPSPKEIVWKVIKKKGPLSPYQVSELIPTMTYGSINSILSDLYRRNMLKVVGRDFRSRIYATDMEHFELLPMPETPKEETQSVDTENEQPIVVVKTQEAPVKPKIDLETLTVREAKELYKELQQLFG